MQRVFLDIVFMLGMKQQMLWERGCAYPSRKYAEGNNTVACNGHALVCSSIVRQYYSNLKKVRYVMYGSLLLSEKLLALTNNDESKVAHRTHNNCHFCSG